MTRQGLDELDLDIKNMKESYNLNKENNNLTTRDNEKKYIAGGIQENPFGIFIKRLVQLTSKYGITINKINRYYPSSKKCSVCGEIRKNLKLSDRTYICDKCGLIIDRDLNAAINIAIINKRNIYTHTFVRVSLI